MKYTISPIPATHNKKGNAGREKGQKKQEHSNFNTYLYQSESMQRKDGFARKKGEPQRAEKQSLAEGLQQYVQWVNAELLHMVKQLAKAGESSGINFMQWAAKWRGDG